MLQKKTTITNDFRKLLAHISKKRQLQLIGLTILMLIGAAAEMASFGALVPFLGILANPDLTQKYPIINLVISYLNLEKFDITISASIIFILLTLISASIRVFLTWGMYRITYGVGSDIGSSVYLKTLYRPYAWHSLHNTSEIVSGIQKVDIVTRAIIVQALQGVVALTMASSILLILLIINYQTALIAGIGFTTIYSIVSWITRNNLHKNSKTIAQSETERLRAVQEGLGGIRDVLIDSLQPIYHQKFRALDVNMRRAQADNIFMSTSPRYIIESIGMILIVSLALWLSSKEGGLSESIPILGALAIGAQKLLPQMQQVYGAWTSINGNKHLLHDVLSLLEYKTPKFKNEHNTSESPTKHPESLNNLDRKLITFDKVSFKHQSQSNLILNHVSFDIKIGARIGIVGKTGSGKSTLVDLIMGLLDPSEGKILINEQALDKNTIKLWQKRISHVPQTIFLTDSTIAENIAFGEPRNEINYERIRTAAQKSQLAEFIDNLPDKYETQVGERGVRLSGGQRQRIGLARALYKNADVLILDEATSALDDITENAVMRALTELGKEITVLMIAHRLSTLSHCDSILILDANMPPKWTDYKSLIELKIQHST